jgi:glycerol-3-phosphate acyltransferase PlsY
MMYYNFIIIALLSYLIGSFSTAFVFNRAFNKIDPRETGSKNLGALNTLRITSKKSGKVVGIIAFLIVFLVDAFKGAFCVWFAMQIMPANIVLASVVASFFVVLGHNYSILLKFDGGRGAATFLGILLFLKWQIFVIWLLYILLCMFLFEVVSPVSEFGDFYKRAISDQIIGRIFGEIVVLIPLFFLNIQIFWIALAVTPLIVIRHIDRIKEQIKTCKK